MSQPVLALRYPERAESLSDFQRYRVFLDHWQPLIDELSTMRRALYVRRESRTLGIYAPQGSGKTLFARHLQGDIARSQASAQRDSENLWHRIAEERLGDGSTEIAPTNNLKVVLRDAGHDDDWANDLRAYLEQSHNRAIVLLDEADQAYLQLRLLGMDMQEFLRSSDPRRLLVAAADKYVKQCRTVLRGSLFIMLSNKREFLTDFASSVNSQHDGMMVVSELPLADATTKEKVVRINTNRLNSFSYWYCINNARPVGKSKIYDALSGAGTFPAAFQAVDSAISDADQTRIGRPAIKNSLTLCIMSEDPDRREIHSALGAPSEVEYEHQDCRIEVWADNWAATAMGAEAKASGEMLQSEWNLRIVYVGQAVVGALLDPGSIDENLKELFKALFDAPSTYAKEPTLQRLRQLRDQSLTKISGCAALVPATFWSQGQSRSHEYEPVFRRLFPEYDSGSTQIPGFRPDLMVSPYKECSLVAVGANEADRITKSIRRDANFVELTATRKITKASVVTYLGAKLKNYVRLMEGV